MERARVVACLQPKPSNGRHVPLETARLNNRRPKQSEHAADGIVVPAKANATENI
jgi:hypothetical protein